jgi:hypothetical protein
LIYVTLILATVILTPAQSPKQPNQLSKQLRLMVKTDHLTYRMSDTLQIETQVMNAGNQDAYIWTGDLCWNPARGLSMQLVAANGFLAKGDLFLDCVPPPPKAGDVYQFIKLEPGAFHGRSDTLKVSELVDKPGSYDLSVTFSSFLSRKFIEEFYARDPISKLPVWTKQEPILKAQPVKLTIIP